MAKSILQVRADLERDGVSIADWATKHKFTYHVVREVINGRCKAKRGAAHRCAVLLGLKDGRITNNEGKQHYFVDGEPADEKSAN